ncbi:hypothetical protein BZM27_51710 [Paraburkholderia steynii]|uniref:Uncharacterized protein n=1 Tax=Paraburkholderia steynii TaxID=1245441 RepID=A0A4R0XAT1_9BURK|nr:hypothetical protein BZM27_51710 [Paraburkholderia steynii]
MDVRGEAGDAAAVADAAIGRPKTSIPWAWDPTGTTRQKKVMETTVARAGSAARMAAYIRQVAFNM